MTYYFFHIRIESAIYQGGYASGVRGFYENEAPTPADALEKIKAAVHAQFPMVEASDLEVTQFNNVAQ